MGHQWRLGQKTHSSTTNFRSAMGSSSRPFFRQSKSDPSCPLARPPLSTFFFFFFFCTSLTLSQFPGTAAKRDGGPGLTLFPLQRCKTIHLVRHAQGIHNVYGAKNYTAYLSPEFFDAQLTPLGWQQVDNLRKHVHASGLSKRIELVITSPLLRTLQTAVGVFGGEGYTDRMDMLPLMVANAGNSDRPAISSLNSPPIIAAELCREQLGVHPCDRRRNISDYQHRFPAIDFSLIESDEDILWKANIRETKEEVAARGMKFMNWLWTRKEKEIAIVTHSSFLFHTLSAFVKDGHPEEICKHFTNCELFSMVIVDRSMTGSNYPGKIPSGSDIANDAVGGKLENENSEL